jgi:hypothetical protein
MTLDDEQKAVENKFFGEVRENLNYYVSEYRKRFGNFISTDNAREFSTEYNQSNDSRARFAAAVQEPASLIIKAVYSQILQEFDKDIVVFLAGGGGSGKNTSVANLADFQELIRDQIVYETIMSDFDAAVSKVDAALALGKGVDIKFIYRPIEQAALGVLDRAAREGRTYPVEPLSEGHFYAQRTILGLAKHYENNPLVSISVIDNSRGVGQARAADLELVEQNLYNSIDEVQQRARSAISEGYQSQAERGIVIPESIYRALVGGESSTVPRASQQESGTDLESAQRPGSRSAGTTEQLPLEASVEADSRQDATLLNSPENQRQALSILQVAKRLLNTYGGSGSEREFNMRKSGYAIRQKDSTFIVLNSQGKEIVGERDGQLTFDIEAPDIKVFESAEKHLNKERDRGIDGR